MSSPAAHRTCPGCTSAMQIFHVSLVELDLCLTCGGVWLDRNAVEAVAGRMLAELPRESAIVRPCAACREPLEPTMLEGVQVECCASCRGVYLDKGELEQLAMRQVSFKGPAVRRATDGSMVTFQCPGCEGEHLASQGVPWGRGLVCQACAPRFGVSKSEPIDGTRVADWAGSAVLNGIIETIVGGLLS